MRKASGYQSTDAASRYRGLGVVAVLHLLLAWALVSGTARKGLDMLKKPLEAVVIQEVIIPPPPPPPPPVKKEIKAPESKAVTTQAPPPVPPPFVPPAEVAPPPTAAPAIVAIPTPPSAPVVISPPTPPAPPAPAAKAAQKADIGVACPTQVAPEMPRRALQDGTEGVVKAQILIKDGVVKDVTILSGPRVFHNAVRAAMLKYRCSSDGEVLATQEFNFKLE